MMVNIVEDLTKHQAEFPKAKGAERIQINNFMGAVSVGVLAVLLSLNEARFSRWAIGQLAISIPFFFTSSLAYSKLCYRDPKECPIWDKLGWITHSMGYIATLNAVIVLLYQSPYGAVTWILVATTVLLFAAYSILDVVLDRVRVREKLYKFGFYMLLIVIGSILPIIKGWQ